MNYDVRIGAKEKIDVVIFDGEHEIHIIRKSLPVIKIKRKIEDYEVIIQFKDINNLIKALEFIKREENIDPITR